MNSMTFKVIRRGRYIYPVGWKGLRMPICYAVVNTPRLFPWAGLYDVTLRVNRRLGLFVVAHKWPPNTTIHIWSKGFWRDCAELCIPQLRRIPLRVPFNAHTKWLRKATTAELAKWCKA